MDHITSRRGLVKKTLGTMAAGTTLPALPSGQRGISASRARQSDHVVVVSVAPNTQTVPTFARESFGIVGIYDGDWFGRPEFATLLDNLAASPRAFQGVRFFGTFTAGYPERFLPEDRGRVWPAADDPTDFSAAFTALAKLTARDLIPFVSFGFFPPAVSESMLQPPREWGTYIELVRAFLEGLADDPRFGPDAIANWWFEAWNEPNEGRFWTGTVEEYFDLYRATSQAIAQTGLSIRFGGPAIAYKPQVSPEDGAPWIERFLRFIAAEPDVQCDFISYHRKGTVTDDEPDPRLMYWAAVTTAEQLREIDAERFAGMVIINNEADEKVGFEHPYVPRLDERNASWLATVGVIHGGLTARYVENGFRLIGAADNANLQLVEAPFDGRRSIMTYAGDSATDLLKISAYAYYELLPLLGDQLGSVLTGADHLFPETDVYLLTTFAATHVGCLVTRYPDPGNDDQATRVVDFTVTNVPWSRVNVARFQIDRELSNAYAAAGGSEQNPFPIPNPADLGSIRLAQELAVVRPIEQGVPLTDGGTYRERLEIAPYTTVVLWITPAEGTAPESPQWISGTTQDGNVVLKWTPARETNFYSYEVLLMNGGVPGDRLSPTPLRSAMWIDTAPPAGPRRYGVRTITASGVMSPIVTSEEFLVT